MLLDNKGSVAEALVERGSCCNLVVGRDREARPAPPPPRRNTASQTLYNGHQPHSDVEQSQGQPTCRPTWDTGLPYLFYYPVLTSRSFIVPAEERADWPSPPPDTPHNVTFVIFLMFWEKHYFVLKLLSNEVKLCETWDLEDGRSSSNVPEGGRGAVPGSAGSPHTRTSLPQYTTFKLHFPFQFF